MLRETGESLKCKKSKYKNCMDTLLDIEIRYIHAKYHNNRSKCLTVIVRETDKRRNA